MGHLTLKKPQKTELIFILQIPLGEVGFLQKKSNIFIKEGSDPPPPMA